VLVGIGWLDVRTVERWRRGQIDCLERAVRTNLPRISEAMKLLRSWARERSLSESPTHYVARGPQRQTLRFSRSGDSAIEAMYRTHWVSQQLSEKKRERLAEKASLAPDLVVIRPLNREWTCHRRGNTGDLLMMENPGPACLACVGLDDLEFFAGGRCAAVAAGEGEKHEMRGCRALQPNAPPLRTTRPAGRAFGRGGRCGTTSKRSEASDNLPWTSSIGQSPPASHPTHNASIDAAPVPKVRAVAEHPAFSVHEIIFYFNHIRVRSFVLGGAP